MLSCKAEGLTRVVPEPRAGRGRSIELQSPHLWLGLLWVVLEGFTTSAPWLASWRCLTWEPAQGAANREKILAPTLAQNTAYIVNESGRLVRSPADYPQGHQVLGAGVCGTLDHRGCDGGVCRDDRAADGHSRPRLLRQKLLPEDAL